MILKLAKNNLVRKPSQIIGGQRYIEVMYLDGRLHLSTFLVTGRLYKTYGMWFGHQRTNYSWGEYNGEFSPRDRNIPPNHYNLHTMWRFNTATMQWLRGLTTSEHGAMEYLTVLAHYGICENVTAGVSAHEALFDDDPFWQDSFEDELMDEVLDDDV